MTDEMRARACPHCGEAFRLAWLMGDPPEPYGEVCGCPDHDHADALSEKASDPRAWFNEADGAHP